MVGHDETLDMTDANEPAMGVASIAMVVTLEQMDVGGVSLVSVFNEDLFQSQESRAHFSSTQVVNDIDHQALSTTDNYKYSRVSTVLKSWERLVGCWGAKVMAGQCYHFGSCNSQPYIWNLFI